MPCLRIFCLFVACFFNGLLLIYYGFVFAVCVHVFLMLSFSFCVFVLFYSGLFGCFLKRKKASSWMDMKVERTWEEMTEGKP